jgi:hypothetical protein
MLTSLKIQYLNVESLRVQGCPINSSGDSWEHTACGQLIRGCILEKQVKNLDQLN